MTGYYPKPFVGSLRSDAPIGVVETGDNFDSDINFGNHCSGGHILLA